MLLYHGETLFDRANDDSQYFAKTVLGFMVSCMFGGHTFCFKNTTHCEIEFTISSWTKKTYKVAINQSLGEINALICDGNRNNQAFLDCLMQNQSNSG